MQALVLDSVDVCNQFANILKSFRLSETLIELRLANIPIQNSRVEKLADFVVNAYRMHKCVLESNKLENVDFLSTMHQNRSLLELELIDQRFGKEKPNSATKKQAVADSEESDDSQASRLEVVSIDQLRENKTL